MSSSMFTKKRDAASIARRTSGSTSVPLWMVRVPQQLMNGRTPILR